MIGSTIESKNNTNAYVSNHIKRMLNASINSSNPSISAHRNKCNFPGTSNTKDLSCKYSGVTSKNHSTSRPRVRNFNNTQKINIGAYLEVSELEDKPEGKVDFDEFQSDTKHTVTSNKFRLITGNKENFAKRTISKGIDAICGEENVTTNKTPLYNSRPLCINNFKPNKIQPPGEESNAYYKTQMKNQPAKCKKAEEEWKSMTTQHVFEHSQQDFSKGLWTNGKFCVAKNNIMNHQFLELPANLKDIGDSDLEVEDFDSNDEVTNDEV